LIVRIRPFRAGHRCDRPSAYLADPEGPPTVLELAHKDEQWDRQSTPAADPLQPSATIAPFKNPAAPRRTRKPGRKAGRPGACRPVPENIDARADGAGMKRWARDLYGGCSPPPSLPELERIAEWLSVRHE